MDYMNRLKILLFIIFINYISCEGISKSIQHGLAVCDAQKGEWDNACSRMMSILAQDYDDPQILYDAGVAAYRTGQFEQACAYFQDCCSLSGANNELKERAFFNQGNAEVEKKSFQNALDAYEQVLTINPHNQQARHNKEKVKKMLDQQEKQEQEKEQQKSDAQDQQSDNNHNKEDSDSDSKNSNESKNKKENNNEKQENNSQEKKSSSEQSDDQNNVSHNKSSEKQNQNDNTNQHDQPQKQNQDKDSSGQENNSEANQKNNDFSERGDARDSSGDQQTTPETSAAKGQQTKHKEQEEKNEQRSSLKNDQQGGEKNERASVAAQDKNEDLFEKNQAWMAQLLQEQENADKQINKKWVKATMAQSVMDNNENNSW